MKEEGPGSRLAPPPVQFQPISQPHHDAPFLAVPTGEYGRDSVTEAVRILGGLTQRSSQIDGLPALDLDVDARQPNKVRLRSEADGLTGADGVPVRVQDTAEFKLSAPALSLLRSSHDHACQRGLTTSRAEGLPPVLRDSSRIYP